MEVFGYLSAILIGVSLGLIGAGGSILTVPVLVYFFGKDTNLAIEYSLFIVGISSFFGSLDFWKQKMIVFKIALLFGLPSIVAVYLTKLFLMPIIPKVIFTFDGFELSKGKFLLLLFASIMLFASYRMIKETKDSKLASEKKMYFPIVAKGLLVGALTGFVGAGGGFMIIPTLVNSLKVPMKKAIATSLLIVTINSLFGFFVSSYQYEINWLFLMGISAISIIGIFIGTNLSKRFKGTRLKPIFGWFILILSVSIIVKELLN